MEQIISENTELTKRLRDIRHDLVKERAMVCQLTSDKVEAEQRLRVCLFTHYTKHKIRDYKRYLFFYIWLNISLQLCLEERDSAVREKQRLEQRLARHEATTMKTVEQLQEEHKRSASDLQEKYHTLDSEGKQLALELKSSQRLLEAREKEVELLRTKTEHQLQEIKALERQLNLAQEEHQTTRDQMDDINTKLAHKVGLAAVLQWCFYRTGQNILTFKN